MQDNVKVESGFSGKADIKSSIVFLMTDIIRGAKQARSSNSDPSTPVIAWGSQIRAFDAMLYPVFMTDKLFLLRRRKVMNSKLRGSAGNAHFDYYLDWFQLLCEKLPELGIFGEQSASVDMNMEDE